MTVYIYEKDIEPLKLLYLPNLGNFSPNSYILITPHQKNLLIFIISDISKRVENVRSISKNCMQQP
jgi:hypothetical protein